MPHQMQRLREVQDAHQMQRLMGMLDARKLDRDVEAIYRVLGVLGNDVDEYLERNQIQPIDLYPSVVF
jgi:hypothetical protein